MKLIPHQYGYGFPQPHVSDINHTLLLISNFIFYYSGSAFDPAPPETFHKFVVGTLQADIRPDVVRKFPKGLADYNPMSILCSLASKRIIIPRLSSWRKACQGLFTAMKNRSKQNRCCRLPADKRHHFSVNNRRHSSAFHLQHWFCLSWRLCCHATTYGNVPVMLVFSYQRTIEDRIPLTLNKAV